MAAGATYEPIATTTLGSTASSITFSSIPSTYTDLRLSLTPIGTSSSNCLVQFNGDTGTNYSQTNLYGDGTSAGSTTLSDRSYIYLTYWTNISSTPTFRPMDIFSYAGSNYKTILTQEIADLNGSGSVVSKVALWRSTSAITSIYIFNPNTTFAVGTTATLYGIRAA